MALDGPIEGLTEADLLALRDNRVAEHKTLEYKAELNVASDGDRKEFLADVSSLANTAGGHLVIGVAEVDGYPEEVSGIEMPNQDSQILALEGMIRDGVSPRLSATIKPIALASGRIVLIIRVPYSHNRPHMVTFKGGQRFWARDTRGKYPMDVQEIRSAVLVNESVADRIRNFRIDRLATVVGGLTTPPLMAGAQMILHLVPLNALDAGASTDKLVVEDTALLQPIYSGGWNTRRNFDGLVAWDPASDDRATRTYVQLFRNGSVEAAISWPGRSDGDRLLIPSITYEEEIVKALPRLLRLQASIGVSPPAFLMMSIVGIGGFSLGVNPSEDLFGDIGRPVDRNEILLPEVLLESLDVEVSKVLQPLFDIVWNSAGYERSLNFDEDGHWVGAERKRRH